MSRLLPPCTNTCPVHTDVRGYIAAVARRDYKEACRLIRANNPFPAVCAWICHHPCEDACRRAVVDTPLSIRALKRFAVEMAGNISSEAARSAGAGRKVAVIGGGPSGLTAAYDLARLGHRVVVYERHRSPGGHFLSSLPTYRLPREMLKRDVEEILAAGVEIRTGTSIGRNLTVGGLREEYDAVIIAAGLWVSRGLDLPGLDHPGVYAALQFLERVNLGDRPEIGSRVTVIGGGNVALDVARTAVRLGGSDVRVFCLESRAQMPAHSRDIDEAAAEGVQLSPGYGPVEIVVNGGKVSGVAVKKVLSIYDSEGKFNPSLEQGDAEMIPCDTVILAIGQAPDLSFLEESGLETDTTGLLTVDRQSLAAGVPGVFACGEIVNGPGSAIAAIASGHRAAWSVDKFLNGKELHPEETDFEAIPPLPAVVAEKVPRRERQKMPALPPAERLRNLLPYELGLAEAAALREAGRCLNCGLGATVAGEKCASCLTCRRVCPYGVPVMKGLSADMPVESCQACGICAAVCPAGAISVGTLNQDAVLDLLEQALIKDRTVLFTCYNACLDSPDAAVLAQANGAGSVQIVKVPTTGALRLEWILKAFENGAAGVSVITCKNDGCGYAGGEGLLEGVIGRARDLMAQVGIPADKLSYVCLNDTGSVKQKVLPL